MFKYSQNRWQEFHTNATVNFTTYIQLFFKLQAKLIFLKQLGPMNPIRITIGQSGLYEFKLRIKAISEIETNIQLNLSGI